MYLIHPVIQAVIFYTEVLSVLHSCSDEHIREQLHQSLPKDTEGMQTEAARTTNYQPSD